MQLLLGGVIELDFSQPWHRSGPVFGDPRLAPYRLGQQAFKAKVLDAYHRRCAITGIEDLARPGSSPHPAGHRGRRAPAGQRPAAPIRRPYPLRPRIPWRRSRLPATGQSRLREDFGNGERFYAQAGQVVALPERRADRPQREFLEWHLGEVFKAS